MYSYSLHQVIRVLAKVADRYAPSRILTFDLAHVFMTMQLMEKNRRISRSILIRELGLGEGSVKTLVKHMKMNGMIETSNAGMWLSSKGKSLYSKLYLIMPYEMDIPRCDIALGKFNHAVLIKNMAANIRSGIEQRDIAIKIGATGATTLIFKDSKFLMPDTGQDFLRKDPNVRSLMLEKFVPEDKDVIIIGSAYNKKVAEMAAKSAALQTIADHEKHF